MKRLRLLGGIIFVATLLWSVGFIFSTPKAHAATIDVVAGTDGIDNLNDQCQLTEAIQNINDQVQTNDDCLAGDGNNDTINLPSGTITLSSDLPLIEFASVSIVGQGIGQTILNGNSQFIMFGAGSFETEGNFSLEGLTITEFSASAIAISDRNVYLNNIEIDGTNSDAYSGTINIRQRSGNRTVDVRNIYAHNLAASQDGESIFRFTNGRSSSASGTMDLSILNVTLDQLYSSNNNFFGGSAIAISTGDPDNNGSNGPVQTNLTVRNLTISDMLSDSNEKPTGLFSISSMTGSGTATTVADIANLSLNNLQSGSNQFLGGGNGLTVAGAAGSEEGTATTTVNLKNSFLSNIQSLNDDDAVTNCRTSNLNFFFGGTGTVNLALSSLGGNISDDDSCSSYFTDPLTDHNNVDSADLHLGTLGNYGGSVPTIPLLEGSIAIDSGVEVPGLTTDARGIARPQCASYDSGAYEYNGTCPPEEPTTDSPPLTYPDPITNSTVSLVLPSDVTNGTVSAINPTTIPKDTFFSYPLGLTSFQFDTTIGATKTITLYYDLPGDPSSYTARKYNTNTKTFSTISNATITRVTYNNKSQLKLTYDITDGGPLDQDNTANGTIIDPVGLAQASVGVPNTGL